MSSMESQQGLLRKAPVPGVSTPVSGQAGSSSGPKTNSSLLKMTAPEAATPSVTDNEVPDSHLTNTKTLGCHYPNVKTGAEERN